MKNDTGKIQYRLVPPQALKAVAQVLTFGAVKYSPFNWMDVESERYLDALYRHLEAHRLGERIDSESGMPHLAHAATNIMFLLEREIGNDIPGTREIGRALLGFNEEATEESNKES